MITANPSTRGPLVGAAVQVPKQEIGEIQGEIVQLSEAIDRLHKLLETATERLHPVLREDTPAKDAGSPADHDVQAPVAVNIRESRGRVYLACGVLSNLLQRLAL